MGMRRVGSVISACVVYALTTAACAPSPRGAFTPDASAQAEVPAAGPTVAATATMMATARATRTNTAVPLLTTTDAAGCPVTSQPALLGDIPVLGPINDVTPEPTGVPPEVLIVVGTLYASDCSPLGDATLELWQTDARGEYGPGEGNAMRCCYVAGSIKTDASGRFTFKTIKPAHYRGEGKPPPAHIHAKIIHAQIATHEVEFVFPGDPHLPPGNLPDSLIPLKLSQMAGEQGSYLLGVVSVVVGPLDTTPAPQIPVTATPVA